MPERVTPTMLGDAARCWHRYWMKWERGLVPALPVEVPRTLGTLIHAGEEAVDLGKPARAGIARAVRAIKAEKTFLARSLPTLDQLEQEAVLIVEGGLLPATGRFEGYRAWRGRHKLDVVLVEERLELAVGELTLTPRLDALARNREGWWVLERKSTTRDDGGWRTRWGLDGQTTLQMLVARTFLERSGEDPDRLRGVLIEQILYSRKSSKRWTAPLPQPLHRVSRPPARMVPKPGFLLAEALERVREFGRERARRRADQSWPKQGQDNRACDFCDYRLHCLGQMPESTLRGPRG